MPQEQCFAAPVASFLEFSSRILTWQPARAEAMRSLRPESGPDLCHVRPWVRTAWPPGLAAAQYSYGVCEPGRRGGWRGGAGGLGPVPVPGDGGKGRREMQQLPSRPWEL